ncbi:hypothetical protein BHM03_00016111, partial [Ensete ventricosum]
LGRCLPPLEPVASAPSALWLSTHSLAAAALASGRRRRPGVRPPWLRRGLALLVSLFAGYLA